MNLVLFEPSEIGRPLPLRDPRARHILEVLRRRPGDVFDCGRVDGPRGKATLAQVDGEALALSFSWESEPPAPLPAITLLVGLPRPQTARKILLEATTLGCARMGFFPADRGERSYARSSLWSSGEVRGLLLAGAAQAFCTRLPEVRLHADFREALASSETPAPRIALDNYEASAALDAATTPGPPAVLAVGPERGWSPAERDALRDAGFALLHLGPRVLRTETACVAGIAVVLSGRARRDDTSAVRDPGRSA